MKVLNSSHASQDGRLTLLPFGNKSLPRIDWDSSYKLPTAHNPGRLPSHQIRFAKDPCIWTPTKGINREAFPTNLISIRSRIFTLKTTTVLEPTSASSYNIFDQWLSSYYSVLFERSPVSSKLTVFPIEHSPYLPIFYFLSSHSALGQQWSMSQFGSNPVDAQVEAAANRLLADESFVWPLTGANLPADAVAGSGTGGRDCLQRFFGVHEENSNSIITRAHINTNRFPYQYFQRANGEILIRDKRTVARIFARVKVCRVTIEQAMSDEANISPFTDIAQSLASRSA